MARIEAVPIEYVNSMLSANDDHAMMSTHIIRRDGSFVLSNTSVDYEDYFISLDGRYPDEANEAIDKYIEELSTAMEKKESYSGTFEFDENRYTVRRWIILSGIF